MLYRNENENLNKCKICGESSYNFIDGEKMGSPIKGNRTAVKKMWYFPLKPRLQRLFWSPKTANMMGY